MSQPLGINPYPYTNCSSFEEVDQNFQYAPPFKNFADNGAYQPHWGDYGTGYAQGSYALGTDQMVVVRGLIAKSTNYAGFEIIATLPVGFRPALGEVFACPAILSTGEFVFFLAVNPDGTITLNQVTGGFSPAIVTYLSLSGISFQQAN